MFLSCAARFVFWLHSLHICVPASGEFILTFCGHAAFAFSPLRSSLQNDAGHYSADATNCDDPSWKSAVEYRAGGRVGECEGAVGNSTAESVTLSPEI